MTKLCLNMIVKDEHHVIERCLKCVKPYIDYWVIVDTGSTDGTQEIIKNFMNDVPGELHESPWVDFAHNRNEALQLARSKGDYIFIVDADEQFKFSPEFDKSKWEKDFYLIKGKGEYADFYHPNIVNNSPAWSWKGVLHEYITSTERMEGELLLTVENIRAQDGSRAYDPMKQHKIAEGLVKAIEKEPENSRYYFYLAQTYAAMREHELALKYYELRSTMEGDKDETFWTWYRLGCTRDLLNKDFDSIVKTYCKAFALNTNRAEPLERLAGYLARHECPTLSYIIADYGRKMTQPIALNSDFYPWVYNYALLSIYADSAFYLLRNQEALIAYNELENKDTTPEDLKTHCRNQIQIINRRIEEENWRADQLMASKKR